MRALKYDFWPISNEYMLVRALKYDFWPISNKYILVRALKYDFWPSSNKYVLVRALKYDFWPIKVNPSACATKPLDSAAASSYRFPLRSLGPIVSILST